MATTYRMPAEWAPHEATFLTWPHDASIWRGVHAAVEQTWVRLIAALAEVEHVHVSVPDTAVAEHVDRLLRDGRVHRAAVSLHLVPSNDVWARDHGPTVVFARDGAGPEHRVFLDWIFNAWGDKYDSALDDAVPRHLGQLLGFPRVEPGLVLEGGSIEVNGVGDLLTTESVLLNPNRNPGLDQAEIEARLRSFLGVRNILWLGDGLTGDDTDGHIDDLARFVDERTIVTVMPDDQAHPDHAALADNLERLRSFQSCAGGRFEVVTLPMPEPVHFGDEHLPASYANYYVANGRVIVPVFDQPSDTVAKGILGELMPGREIVGIDARALVSQYGAFHCITQQLPALP